MENTKSNNSTVVVVLIILLVLTGIGIGLYFLLRKKPTTGSTSIKGSGLGTQSAITSSAFPLKQGSINSYVRALQTALVAKGANIGSTGIDGNFGPNTAAALVSLGYPMVVSQDLFNQILNSQSVIIAPVSGSASVGANTANPGLIGQSAASVNSNSSNNSGNSNSIENTLLSQGLDLVSNQLTPWLQDMFTPADDSPFVNYV